LITAGFDAGGHFCFDDIRVTGLPNQKKLRTSDNKIVGVIVYAGEFSNSTIVYSTPAGDCYTGDISIVDADGWVVLNLIP